MPYFRVYFYDVNDTELHFTIKMTENYDINPFYLTAVFRDLLHENSTACKISVCHPVIFCML